MTLCQSMQCSIPGRKIYNQIWPVLPSSGDILFEVSASQVSDEIVFCSVLLPSTVNKELSKKSGPEIARSHEVHTRTISSVG